MKKVLIGLGIVSGVLYVGYLGLKRYAGYKLQEAYDALSPEDIEKAVNEGFKQFEKEVQKEEA